MYRVDICKKFTFSTKTFIYPVFHYLCFFWNNYSKTTFLKESKIIGREMKLIFDKWNLEKIKKIKN